MTVDTMLTCRSALATPLLAILKPLANAIRRLSIMLVVAATAVVGVAQAGDPEAGLSKSATCAACHGTTGQSDIAPTNPILAGQYESYLINALQAYRSGERQNAIMQGFASQLSDEDIEDLAAFFSSQEGPLQTAPSK